MKKLVIALALMFGFAGFASAQKVAPTDAKANTATTTGTKTSTKATLTKADGTPDMRFKANQDAAKTKPAKVPLKADGTPDMRYKANNANAGKTKTTKAKS
ncbi:MAG TPA: hypothetical protein VKH37_09215 [Ferruginibacter sp.]|nr:hypothetical protein [Ferruginibacter sp.]